MDQAPAPRHSGRRQRVEPILREIMKIHSVASLAWHLGLQPIIVPYQQDLGRTLALLLAGVVLLLMIGCANCSILLLARGRTRQHELAIRTAIGASRWRIVRQLLVEAVVNSFPAESIIRINAPILAFSVTLALLCGILFGLAPALRLSRHNTARMLPGRQIGMVGAPTRHRWSILISAQVALTLLLMATAGTAIRSFLHLTQTPLGYDPANVMKVGMQLHTHNLDEWSRILSREARTSRSPPAASTAPSPSTRPLRTMRSTAASGSSRYCLASSLPWRSDSRWSASSASSLTASRSALRSSVSAWRSARRARRFCGSPRASRS
jgi:hypothetical protein